MKIEQFNNYYLSDLLLKKTVVAIIAVFVVFASTLTIMSIPAFAMTKNEIHDILLERLYGESGGKISCGFDGYSSTSGRHEGIDCVYSSGHGVYSILDGKVTSARQASNGLTTIAIYNSSFDVTIIYLHTKSFAVSTGDTVTQGQKIALEGRNGASSAHTHVELRPGYQTSASKSTDDPVLNNPDPYPYYEEIFNEAESYTNRISLWANGFKNNEGNNDSKNMFRLGQSSFQEDEGERFKFATNFNKVPIPNGFTLDTNKWGSSDFTGDGTWKWYSFNDTVVQPDYDTWSQFSCDPIQYKITYNLNGGTNNRDNPSTYNVLYGVTLKDPVKEGYVFDGWTDSSGKKVTGINEGANASFSSAEDMISKLSSRTTGNQALIANWKKNYIELWATGFENGEGSNSQKDCIYLGESSFSKKVGEAFRFTPDLNTVSVPNGYVLDTESWGSHSFTEDDTWKWYTFNDTVTQPAKETWSQYFCNPVRYSIIYNLDGGTNNEDNPSTYNILYGVTLKDPEKEGYVFDGWTDSSGNKVTGINEGANASFSSPDDMMNQLGIRTTGDQELTANWKSDSITTFTNNINLWANGFERGEGNNADKDCYYIGTSSYIKCKGDTFVFSKDFNTVNVPNGFELSDMWGSNDFSADNSWNWYYYSDIVKQPSHDTRVQYSCDPIQYKITYRLNGGTNNEDNPSTYNVLYGIVIKDPVRKGYVFDGWTDKSGKKVTGINEGENASFKSVDDLMSQLKSRTTGDQELTAVWKEDPDAPLMIHCQPGDAKARAGEKISISIVASGNGKMYQWQWSVDGIKWNNCTGTGNNSDTFSFIMQKKYDGRRYRCIVSNGEERVTSEVGQVSLIEDLKIIHEPKDVEASNEESVILCIKASGRDLSYRWQWSADGSTWKNCTGVGNNTDTFSFTMKGKYDGRKYRCIVAAPEHELISQVATVKLLESELRITEDPLDTIAETWDRVGLHVAATGNDLNYQWQWSTDGSAWRNCIGVGYNTDTFSFTMKPEYGGRKYRCIVSDGEDKVSSKVATVSLIQELMIIQEPDNTEAHVGENVSLYVEVTGNDLNYQWQWSADGSAWRNCIGVGYNTDTFSFTMKPEYGGRKYRCVVSNEKTEVVSDSATVIILADAVSITLQPENQSASVGETVEFHVEASGEELSYQWQWKIDGTSWRNCTAVGNDTSVFSFVMKETLDGRMYRCLVVDGDGKMAISEMARIELISLPMTERALKAAVESATPIEDTDTLDEENEDTAETQDVTETEKSMDASETEPAEQPNVENETTETLSESTEADEQNEETITEAKESNESENGYEVEVTNEPESEGEVDELASDEVPIS